MNPLRLILKILFSFFFTVSVLVHIIGLIKPFSDEPVFSHIIHIVSYSICLFMTIRAGKHPLVLFLAAALYPFLFHSYCAIMPWIEEQRFSPICWMVVFTIPIAALWQWAERNENTGSAT